MLHDVEINVSEEEIDLPDTFGEALRRIRSENGVSLSILGRMVHYSKGHLSKIENDIAPASLELAEACDAALHASGQLIAAYVADMARPAPLSSATLADRPFDIPPAPSHFIGRSLDRTRVIEAILTSRDSGRATVVLIHGMPGIGKTALALHVAHTLHARYPGGCLFVDFGGRGDPGPGPEIHARLLRRLGIAGEAVPAEPAEARARYLSILYRRPVLIVADGVTSSEQVSALVSASPACAVIATSRRRLDALDDCHAIGLGPLAADDAMALFSAIAGSDAELDSPDDLARIAVACDGAPLALRVAAAKFRGSSLSTAELAELLENPATAWDELDDGERSVRRAIRTEVDSLRESGRRTLTMLGLHAAEPAGCQTIAWLADSSRRAVAEEFTELARHHLVTVDQAGRARVSGLVRAFASDAASELDERARSEAMHRLVTGYALTAAAADRVITPQRFQPPASGEVEPFGDQAQAMAWCRAEAGLIARVCSVAFDLGLDDECWRLAYAMRDYFFAVKATVPWVASHRTALLAAERSGDLRAQAITRNNLGMAYAEQGRITAAETQYRSALRLMHTIDDPRGVAATLGHQAWANHAAGRHETAVPLAEQAIEFHRRHDDRRALAIMDRTVALARAQRGQHRDALRHLAECREILSELDLPLDTAMMLNCMGEVHLAMGQDGQAEVFYARAAEHAAACGGLAEQARALRGLAVTARAARADARADDLQCQAAALVVSQH
jgi:tetratricopeptide (TPR) repeat protein/transcriptional regulator with XRE-family HTH domain